MTKNILKKRVKVMDNFMDKFYDDFYKEQVMDVIFRGTMHNPNNMRKWLEKFREDRRKGKFR